MIDRLIKEFGAQDGGATMVCFLGGKHIEVAKYNNANDGWDLLPAGKELLAPAVVEEPAPAAAGLSPAERKGGKQSRINLLSEE